MNTKMVWTAAAALAVALIAGPASAQQAKDKGGEATPTAPYKASGTKEERKAERKEKRDEITAAEKKGPVGQSGEASPTAPNKVSGTKAEREAERKAKRAEITAAEKKGEIPRATESGDPKK